MTTTLQGRDLKYRRYSDDDDNRYLPAYERVILPASPEQIRVEFSDGTVAYYLNGRLHREDGPAVETASGFRHWKFRGMTHREGGPAIEWPNGTQQWVCHGETFKFRCPANPSLNEG